MFNRSYSRNRFSKKYTPRGRNSSIGSSNYIKKAVSNIDQEVYKPLRSFNDFPIDIRIKNNISKRGYINPTPIQDQSIPHMLEGKDVVGIANTGTGKTAAFLIPIIHKIIQNPSEKVLIIVPTRELALQIQEEFRAFSKELRITSLLCIGGSSINYQIYTLRQNPNIIIGTPGRLRDLITRKILNMLQFKTIVLDEVDRMVDIGFIKDIKFMISLLPRIRQSLFFSATVSPDINNIIRTFLTNPIMISVKVKETAQGIEQDIIRVKSKQEKIEKLDLLLRQEDFKKVLIFGRTKWNVERLARLLLSKGIAAASIHGNKSQNQRFRALSLFKKNQLQVLVATDIAARGLDIEDVSHVINYDEPSNYTDYVHRIGRTGRANKQGKALTFVL